MSGVRFKPCAQRVAIVDASERLIIEERAFFVRPVRDRDTLRTARRPRGVDDVGRVAGRHLHRDRGIVRLGGQCRLAGQLLRALVALAVVAMPLRALPFGTTSAEVVLDFNCGDNLFGPGWRSNGESSFR